MSHPDSNFNLGKMLHREYEAAVSSLSNDGSNSKRSVRIFSALGLVVVSAVVLTLIMFL
ncbi:MAG: hypothetical protein AAF902_08745 [Chloroflexota bacterium]